MSGSLPSQSGRLALVTGASSGIGFWTALGLARAGARVILAGRSREKLEAAAERIARQTGRRPRTEIADFASLRAVRAMAASIGARDDRLDILVNNAGLMTARRQVSADGYELTFAVNHLAPFVLTRALLPMLRRAAAARVVTVASTAHQRGRIAWDDLMSERRFGPMTAYAQSKLANILFTTAMARRLADSPATANAVHPGVVGTAFGEVGGPIGLAWRLGRPFLLSPQQGAATTLYVATAPELGRVSGQYFARSRAVRPAAAARDAQAAERLWDVSEALAAKALA